MQREYAADQVKRLDMTADHKRQLLTMDIDTEKQQIEFLKNIGALSDQEEIARLKDLENRKNAIEVEALGEKLAAARQGSLEEQKLMNDLEVTNRKHAQAMGALNIKGMESWLSPMKNIFDQMEQGFNKAIDGMLTGQTRLSQSLKNAWNSMVLDFAHMAVKMTVRWIGEQAMQVAATALAETSKTAAAVTGATERQSISIMETIKSINNKAVDAAAGAYNAIVGIPYVGPALAPVAAGVAYAGVMAFGAMASASGGYDIPAGINPVTQLHAQEMVLPAHLANTVRDSVGGGPGGASTTYNISALDAKSFKHCVSGNMKALKSLNRDFGFTQR